ncbi:MAG TPA: hypothetical protein VFS43_00525 [Polyangiaceae bacterium]|nr:hypothetical protein [Polyangiaceae bacterium]
MAKLSATHLVISCIDHRCTNDVALASPVWAQAVQPGLGRAPARIGPGTAPCAPSVVAGKRRRMPESVGFAFSLAACLTHAGTLALMLGMVTLDALGLLNR